ncbi:MAG: hypothetical protein HYR96_05415 [Deltaproteobacteria bacterium]|nr:hypothetical protein [Deltaproteobacteria bacterium]MBI3295594.1 hypothetical protein [Deltaproteobacteria bacterium]
MRYVRGLTLLAAFCLPAFATDRTPAWTPECIQCQKTMMSETMNCAAALADPATVTTCMTNAGDKGTGCYFKNNCPKPDHDPEN